MASGTGFMGMISNYFSSWLPNQEDVKKALLEPSIQQKIQETATNAFQQGSQNGLQQGFSLGLIRGVCEIEVIGDVYRQIVRIRTEGRSKAFDVSAKIFMFVLRHFSRNSFFRYLNNQSDQEKKAIIISAFVAYSLFLSFCVKPEKRLIELCKYIVPLAICTQGGNWQILGVSIAAFAQFESLFRYLIREVNKKNEMITDQIRIISSQEEQLRQIPRLTQENQSLRERLQIEIHDATRQIPQIASQVEFTAVHAINASVTGDQILAEVTQTNRSSVNP